MKLYYYILGAVLLIILTGIYYHLGGFRKIKVEKIRNPDPYEIKIWGKHYTGNLQDKEWKSLFVNIRDLIVKKNLKGPITVVYFKEPSEKKNDKNIDAFVGSNLFPGTRPPASLTELDRTFNGMLRVRLTMHPVVMPSPRKVKKKISRYAAMNNLQLDSIHIEKYYQNNTLTVEVPLK